MFKNILGMLLLLFSSLVFSQTWDFTLFKHQSDQPGPTLLVIGGIQGDEPGGFNAASLLTTDYTIQRGEVWVVPNLNFESIIKRSRGVHGDMNRKFKHIPNQDPEYQLVQKIKKIIRDEQVDLILNLHDGSGFYRPEYIDSQHSPHRWGQSLIIDQAKLEHAQYGQLNSIAADIVKNTNARIADKRHYFHVKNTKTRLGNREMEKTLTYYAIQHQKAAFGLEASKAFDTHYRAYYHLQLIESFMQHLGIEYQREFKLTINNVKERIDNNIKVALYNNKMYFDMSNVRKRLGYVPMKKGAPVDYRASNPLVAVLNNNKYYNVRYGNRAVTKLVPQYFDFDNSLKSIQMLVDGVERQVEPGNIVSVDEYFEVNVDKNYRVNVIGFTRTGLLNEQGIRISQSDIRKHYSVDTHGQVFRIEVYRKNNFCGMILVDFSSQPVATASTQQSDASL
jgi:hypothetical protein